MSINKAIVVGNLGQDPEVRALRSGQSVASFSIATTARFKDRNGEPQERTEWHRVVAFGSHPHRVRHRSFSNHLSKAR